SITEGRDRAPRKWQLTCTDMDRYPCGMRFADNERLAREAAEQAAVTDDAQSDADAADAPERSERDDRRARRRRSTLQLEVPDAARIAWGLYAHGLGVRPRDVALILLQAVAEDRTIRNRMRAVATKGTYLTRWTE